MTPVTSSGFFRRPGTASAGRPLSRLLSYFGRYRARALSALAAMAVVSISTVVLLFLLQKVVDDVLGTGSAASVAGFGGSSEEHGAALIRWLDGLYHALRVRLSALGLETRVAVPLLLLVALVSKNFFSYISEFGLNTIGLSMVRDLRRDAYRSLLGQSSSFYTESSTGDLMSRLLSDVELIQQAFGNRLADLVQGALTLGLVLFYLFSLNTRLALFVFVLGPLLLLPIIEVARRLRRTAFSSREKMGEMGSLLGETLRGHRVIKTYAMEDFEAERFRQANDRYYRLARRTVRIEALNSPMMEILSGTFLAFLFIYAAGLIREQRLTPGGVISFLAALLMVYKPLKDVTRVNLAMQLALSAAQRLFEMMDRPVEILEKPGGRELPRFASELRYSDVSFSYGEQRVLENLNLVIRRGETLAIVGPSGAGKTTLVNLLPRLYDPERGSVTIDGIDVRDATLSSLRRQIALVTQETVLFDATIAANVAYGQAHPDDDRVRRALRAAYAEEFVDALPEGLQARVGENAARLSGGQRQRIAIARAIYKDAPILILDEATSQLDSESESLVSRALTNLLQGRTTLVIAHRLSTVRRADRIIVLDRGTIVEEGTHAELLTRTGVYRRLHDMQYFAGEAPGEARI
ncbi:MAG TPA: ABC transporter transmembrane domain-containing protein [Thermoanaerobaculia bacterium]|jgi:subfamily B ATP-binding cassette protein MsbA